MFGALKERIEEIYRPKSEGTPITDEANNTLRSWGMSCRHIDELRRILKEFDGVYGNCVKKALQTKTLYVETGEYRSKISMLFDEIGQSYYVDNGSYDRIVSFPEIAGENGLSYIGNCRDITDALIERILASNFLDQVNAGIKDGPIELRISNGNNNTHFKTGSHVWACLVKKSNADSKDAVVLDGSYQEISHLRSNGYKQYMSDSPGDIEKRSPKKIVTSDIEFSEVDFQIYSCNGRVLGLSNDKSVLFSVGFTLGGEKFIPFIRVDHLNGIDGAVFLFNPNSSAMNYSFRRNPFEISDAVAREVREILEALSQTQFEPSGHEVILSIS